MLFTVSLIQGLENCNVSVLVSPWIHDVSSWSYFGQNAKCLVVSINNKLCVIIWNHCLLLVSLVCIWAQSIRSVVSVKICVDVCHFDVSVIKLYAGSLEEDYEDGVKPIKEELSEKQQHQLRHRELFLSRQVETLPATHIRGKCTVTLLNETESLLSYLNRDVSVIHVHSHIGLFYCMCSIFCIVLFIISTLLICAALNVIFEWFSFLG